MNNTAKMMTPMKMSRATQQPELKKSKILPITQTIPKNNKAHKNNTTMLAKIQSSKIKNFTVYPP